MFVQNLIKYSNTGNVGKCPYCGIDLLVKELKTSVRDNLIIKCDNCNKEEYFTGTTKQLNND